MAIFSFTSQKNCPGLLPSYPPLLYYSESKTQRFLNSIPIVLILEWRRHETINSSKSYRLYFPKIRKSFFPVHSFKKKSLKGRGFWLLYKTKQCLFYKYSKPRSKPQSGKVVEPEVILYLSFRTELVHKFRISPLCCKFITNFFVLILMCKLFTTIVLHTN